MNLRSLTAALALFFSLCGAANAGRLAVSATRANVRSGPDMGAEVLWQVEKYHPIELVERSGEWIRFRDFEGDEGWINVSVVDNTETVITKVEKVNIRSGPGMEKPVVFKTESGVPFKVLKREGDWIEIEHEDKDKGWVHGSLVW